MIRIDKKINHQDYIGKKFARLTIIKIIGRNSDSRLIVECQCECGVSKTVTFRNLKSGRTKSCGCLHNELLSERNTTHGSSKSRLYNIWCGIKYRCYQETSSNYQYYGGRGIVMYDKWINSFTAFKDWALSNGYTKNLTIDRIDVNGNYEPNNCRWVTMKIQGSNRTNNHFITYNNETLPITILAKKYNINRNTLSLRLKQGWSIEKALKTPMMFRKKRK